MVDTPPEILWRSFTAIEVTQVQATGPRVVVSRRSTCRDTRVAEDFQHADASDADRSRSLLLTEFGKPRNPSQRQHEINPLPSSA